MGIWINGESLKRGVGYMGSINDRVINEIMI